MKNAMLLFALVGSVGAQVPTGTIAGVVRDPSGAAVSGARLKVVSLATNVARTEASSEQGDSDERAGIGTGGGGASGRYKCGEWKKARPRTSIEVMFERWFYSET